MNPLENPTPAAVVDIDMSNAQAQLIEASQQRPVVALFWTPRAPECMDLIDTLTKLANEYKGDFLLAKVNTDELGAIAQQLGVRNVPTTMVLQNGQPVDGFAGVQDEAGVRTLLDQYLPKPWDRQLQQAREYVAQENVSAALDELQPAYQDSGERADIANLLASCLVHQHRLDEAEAVLAKVPMADQDALYQQTVSQIELKRSASQSPELTALEDKLKATPDDLSAKLQLALQYHEVFENRKACSLLIEVLRAERDFDNGGAKRVLLDIFKSLGNKDPLVVEFQRQLFSLMY